MNIFLFQKGNLTPSMTVVYPKCMCVCVCVFGGGVQTGQIPPLDSVVDTGMYSRNSLMRPPEGLSQNWSSGEVVALVKDYLFHVVKGYICFIRIHQKSNKIQIL